LGPSGGDPADPSGDEGAGAERYLASFVATQPVEA
jgi:hypothetical protein